MRHWLVVCARTHEWRRPTLITPPCPAVTHTFPSGEAAQVYACFSSPSPCCRVATSGTTSSPPTPEEVEDMNSVCTRTQRTHPGMPRVSHVESPYTSTKRAQTRRVVSVVAGGNLCHSFRPVRLCACPTTPKHTRHTVKQRHAATIIQNHNITACKCITPLLCHHTQRPNYPLRTHNRLQGMQLSKIRRKRTKS